MRRSPDGPISALAARRFLPQDSFAPLQRSRRRTPDSVQPRARNAAGMSQEALAFGMMALFLFFMALAVSGLDVGTCPRCDHCRDLRRAEEEERRAQRADWERRYTFQSQEQASEMARRHARLREERERSSRSDPPER